MAGEPQPKVRRSRGVGPSLRLTLENLRLVREPLLRQEQQLAALDSAHVPLGVDTCLMRRVRTESEEAVDVVAFRKS